MVEFNYMQMEGSTYSPTYYGHGRVFVEPPKDKGCDAPPMTINAVKEYGVVPYDKIRGWESDYVIFDDYYQEPFSYLEMCGT